MKKIIVLTMILIFGVAVHGWALPLPSSGDLNSFRTTPSASGIVAYDGWTSAKGGLRLSWSITPNGPNWDYSYTFAKENGTAITKNPSHWLLEVSDIITANNVGTYIFNTNFTLVGPQIWTADPSYSPTTDPTNPGGNGGNPFLPVNIYGIKLDTGCGSDAGQLNPCTYTFTSTQAPMWGDFYTKDGKQGGQGSDKDIVAVAWNTMIGTDPTDSTTNFSGWIPVPDTTNGNGNGNGNGGGQQIPEPGTLLLLGSGLVGFGIFGRKRFGK